MPDTLPRLCVFGDSHYACLKQAETQGLVDVSGVELEYWGHVGGRFRYLEFRDGAVHPVDDFTARRFAKFNAKGRLFLPAADFDVILVMGARVYLWGLFQGLLRNLCHGPYLSSGLMRRILTDGLWGQAGYRLAAGLAQTRTARVLLSPIAYYTASPAHYGTALTPEMTDALPDCLPEFWRIVEETVAEDGMTLIRQPDETVVEGLFTDKAFAVADYMEKADFEHHNAAYGALILQQVMPIAREAPRRA
ncbi:hypothetical protein [Tabrizicola sp.]|uniref:hypothetical protein n=1 Tax=Tabrizicola sp. TaxID=2005166 RepID=UPI003F3F0749